MLTVVVYFQLCVTLEALEKHLHFHHCFVMAWASDFWHINLMNALLQIVSRKSATIGVVHENIEGIEGDHRQICRIKDESEYSFRRIVQECRKLGSGVPEKQRRR